MSISLNEDRREGEAEGGEEDDGDCGDVCLLLVVVCLLSVFVVVVGWA